MQMRCSSSIGVRVMDEESGEDSGALSGILIHPDTGKIEGFFVQAVGFLNGETLFLSSVDIRSWGLRVNVKNVHVLSPVEDLIRLQPLLEDPRTLIGQKIQTESGEVLGACVDVQFDTRYLQVDWLFPKKWRRWKNPISLRDVIEVRPDFILVRDQKEPIREPRPGPETLLKVPDMA